MKISFDTSTLIKTGLPVSYFMVLMYLEQKDFYAKEMAVELNISERNIDRIIKVLIEKGYVEKISKVKYQLTDKYI